MQVVITLVLTLSQHHGNEMIKWHPSGAWRRPFFPTCVYTAVSRPTQLLGEWSCAAYVAPKVIYGCVCSSCCFVKTAERYTFHPRRLTPDRQTGVTVGIRTISSWHQSWPRLQPCPHRKSVKARLSDQPWPWLQCACMRPDRGYSGSPIRGINPKTNEQVWRDWKWRKNRRMGRIDLFLFVSILHASAAASDHTIYCHGAQSEPLSWVSLFIG